MYTMSDRRGITALGWPEAVACPNFWWAVRASAWSTCPPPDNWRTCCPWVDRAGIAWGPRERERCPTAAGSTWRRASAGARKAPWRALAPSSPKSWLHERTDRTSDIYNSNRYRPTIYAAIWKWPRFWIAPIRFPLYANTEEWFRWWARRWWLLVRQSWRELRSPRGT